MSDGPVRVLLVEDDPGDARLVREMLRDAGANFKVVHAERLADGLACLERETFDVVVLDLGLPDSQGLATVATMHTRAPELPLVVMTGLVDEEVGSRAVHEGAQDYLMKGQVDGDVLARCIRYAIERNKAEQAMRWRLEFERTVASISSRFVASSNVDGDIERSLGDLGRLSGADRAYVFLLRDGAEVIDNTHEWCAPGVTPQKDRLQNQPCSMYPWWMNKLRVGEVISVEDVSRMPAEANAEREILEAQDIRSLLVLPLYAGGGPSGFVGFDNVLGGKEWEEEDLLALRLGAEIVGNALSRKRAEQDLRSSEEGYRALFDNKLDGTVVIDIETMEVLLSNRAAAELYGLASVEDSVGMSPLEAVHPEDRERIRQDLHAALCDGASREMHELRVVTRNGRDLWISAVAARVEYGGRPAGLVSFRDITVQKEAEEELRRSLGNLAETVARTAESRDPYTAGHQRRVAQLAYVVGEKMGLDPERLRWLYVGGLLHDIGKIAVPEAILSKPGKLMAEEWSLIRTHARQGYEILKDSRLPCSVAQIALHHHERLDGSGYPDGIGGDKLNLEVRILAVCDVVEAMTSHRPYRPARTTEEVEEELLSARGSKYDSRVVDVLLAAIRGGEVDMIREGVWPGAASVLP